jgi:hypothetical protein
MHLLEPTFRRSFGSTDHSEVELFTFWPFHSYPARSAGGQSEESVVGGRGSWEER